MDSCVKARGLGGFTRALWWRSKESALNKSYCCSLSGDTEREREGDRERGGSQDECSCVRICVIMRSGRIIHNMDKSIY